MESAHHDLVKRSQKYAEKYIEKHGSFAAIAKGQAPEILWIGCADSRVDPSEILGLGPGNIFVHRNVANQTVSTDPNFMAVIEYAVIHLKVKTVVVCGHTSCGGVCGSFGSYDKLEPNLQKFLVHVKNHCEEAKKDHADLSEDKILDKMFSLNAQRGVENIKGLDFVQEAIKSRNMQVLPMLFDLSTGNLSLVE